MRCSNQQQHWPNLGYFLYWYLSSISWPTSKTSGLFSILYRKSIAWVFIFSDSGTFDANSKGQTICSFYYPALGAWLGKCQEAKLSLLDAKHWNWTLLEMSLVWAWLLHQLQVRWSCEHISCRFYSRTQTPHWLCNMSFIFSFCREFCGVECGHPKSIFFSLSEKSLMDGVRHFQCFSILQSSSVNWTPGANISQLCSRNLSPDRTHSISQPQPQPGQSYIGDIQTTYYATNWNLSQNNQDSKYTGREKENTQRQTERDLFCSKLTQTIKIQNQATVTSQEIFVKSKQI